MNETAGLSQALDAIADELEPATGPGIAIKRRKVGTPSPTGAGEAVLQVVDRDGVLHVEQAEPAAATGRRRRGQGDTAAAADIKYERVFERLGRSQIGTWLEGLDKKLTPKRGLRHWGDDGLQPIASVPATGRLLLLIHGTFSDSETLVRNIGENPQGADFFDWARGHYSHILTFDHPTLSVSPMLNARALALALGETRAAIDVICHSRGGLVTRWWLDAFDRAPPQKRRVVFVGSPLAGTGLAAPTNIRGSLSLLSNIGTALGAATAAVPFLTVLTGVFRVVTSVTSLAAKTPAVDAAIALVPGLAAQSRSGDNPELISLRQGACSAAGRYFTVQSNFESEQHGWRFWKYFRQVGDQATDALTDLVFEGHNDLVVDTGSMVDLSDHLSIPDEQVLDFGTTSVVHHTNYFAQPKTLAFIRERFADSPSRASAAGPKEPETPDHATHIKDRSPPAAREDISFSIMESIELSDKFRDIDSVEGHAVKVRPRRGSPKTDREAPTSGIRRRSKPDQQQPPAATAPGSTVLRRTPHLDLAPAGAAAPGTTLRVRVYADKQASRKDEESEDIVIELPADLRQIDLNAYLLVSPQLEVIGSVVQPLKIATDQDCSSVATFEVRVRSRDEILALAPDLPSVGRASISAVFNYGGRPSGSVTRILPLDLDFKVPADSPEVTERVAVGTLRVDTNAKAPDLLVQIRAQPINDGRQFQCWVATPLIAAEEEECWVDWNLPAGAESIVRGYMEGFVKEDASPLERLSAMTGAGRQLFAAAPANFKSVYWKLMDAGHPPKNIAVVSDEPYIPWELMIPHRKLQGHSETRKPLGADCAVGRWVLSDSCAGPQRVPLTDSIVIAPRYTGPMTLPDAEDEAKYVLQHFPGVRIEPAQLETINEVLANRRASILHLSCHGVDAAQSPAQAVFLEDDHKLDTTTLAGLDNLRRALEERPTLVFINACEVGRPKPALVGLGGFAETFIVLGAAGVVAAMWSVRDDLAHEVALDFYRAVLDQPERPFAEVLRAIRARAYDQATGAEDTYAAYCFYGDPLACAAP